MTAKPFQMTNIRTGQVYCFTSEELRDFIYKVTHGRYDNRPVKSEYTFTRNNRLTDEVVKDMPYGVKVRTNLYLATAFFDEHRNKGKNRNILIVYDDDNCRDILPFIRKDVPIYSFKMDGAVDEPNTPNALSLWFRATMGYAYYFMDIDYMFYSDKCLKVLLFEEKGKPPLLIKPSQPQGCGYQTFLREVLIKKLQKADLAVIYIYGNEADKTFCINMKAYTGDTIRPDRFLLDDTEEFTKEDINSELKKFFNTSDILVGSK